jgi:hypothetical protein
MPHRSARTGDGGGGATGTTGWCGGMRRSSAAGESAPTPAKKTPPAAFQRFRYARRIGIFSASSTSVATNPSVRRPTRSSPVPATRRLRTHWVWPRGATRNRSPSTVRRLTGVVRHSPVVRPRTRSSRDPHTLTPARVSSATVGLNT